MAIAITELAQTFTGSAGTTLAVTIPEGGVAEGSRVVVAFSLSGTAGIVSCSDDGGNTYAVDADLSGDNERIVILSAPVTVALTVNDVITVTSPSAEDRSVSVLAITGLTNGGELDQFNTASGITGSASAGDITTTAADEALLTAFSAFNESVGPTFTAGSGWTKGTDNGSSPVHLYTEYRVVSSTGTYTGDGTLFPITSWAGAIASYRAAGENPAPAVAGGYPWNILRRRRRYL